MEKTHSNLGSAIAKKRSQITSMEKSGANFSDISKVETELASMVEKQQGIGSSLSDARDMQSNLVNRAEQLEESLSGAKKAYMDMPETKAKPTMMERVVNAAEGINASNLKSFAKASAPAVVLEAGALGMEYAAKNTTGNTQKVAQVGVDAMNSDTAQFPLLQQVH